MTGDPLPEDVITDDDYEEAIRVQDTVLFAQGEERKVLGRLRVRLERGAVDSGAKYYFDEKRGIVRRRDNSKEA